MFQLESWDQSLFHFINSTLTNAYFDVFFPAVTDLHKTWGFKFIFVPLVLVLLVVFHRLKGLFIFLGLALSESLADSLGNVGKNFWQRPRPFQIPGFEVIQRSGAGGFSFPSNHAVNMFCMATFLGMFFPRYRWVYFSIASLIAFSRVYDGVHFPVDVISGGLLGSLVGFLGAILTRKIIHLLPKKRGSHG